MSFSPDLWCLFIELGVFDTAVVIWDFVGYKSIVTPQTCVSHTSMNAPEEAGVQDVQKDNLACRVEHPGIKLPAFLIR